MIAIALNLDMEQWSIRGQLTPQEGARESSPTEMAQDQMELGRIRAAWAAPGAEQYSAKVSCTASWFAVA